MILKLHKHTTCIFYQRGCRCKFTTKPSVRVSDVGDLPWLTNTAKQHLLHVSIQYVPHVLSKCLGLDPGIDTSLRRSCRMSIKLPIRAGYCYNITATMSKPVATYHVSVIEQPFLRNVFYARTYKQGFQDSHTMLI